MFKDIPEIDCRMFGRYKFMVVRFSEKFLVFPNVVIGKKKKELYFLAPNMQWFNLQKGSGRDEYHIPAPLSKRQILKTLFGNNYP